MKIILFLVLTYFSFVFSYTCKCKYNNKPFEYCCYDEIKEAEIISSDNNKNLAFLYDLIIKTELFFKNVKIERSSEYAEIEKLINNMVYTQRELVGFEKPIYERVKDSKLLTSDEKVKLQILRLSKNLYFEFLDDYGKRDNHLQGLIDLWEVVNKDKILVDLHRRQLVNMIEKKIKELEIEEEL